MRLIITLIGFALLLTACGGDGDGHRSNVFTGPTTVSVSCQEPAVGINTGNTINNNCDKSDNSVSNPPAEPAVE